MSRLRAFIAHCSALHTTALFHALTGAIRRDPDPFACDQLKGMATIPQNLISVPDGAEIVGYTTRSLWHWLETGRLTRYKAGHRTLIDADELVELLAPRAA